MQGNERSFKFTPVQYVISRTVNDCSKGNSFMEKIFRHGQYIPFLTSFMLRYIYILRMNGR